MRGLRSSRDLSLLRYSLHIARFPAMSNAQTITIDLSDGWVPDDSWGTRLATIRQKMGWNWSEAAQACGIDRQSWQNWEAGSDCRDKEKAAKKIAAAAGCNLHWLLTGQVPTGARSRCSSEVPAFTVITGENNPGKRTSESVNVRPELTIVK